LIAYSIHSNFENNVVIIIPNRSVSSTQTRRTVIMKCHMPSSQWRCRETDSQGLCGTNFVVVWPLNCRTQEKEWARIWRWELLFNLIGRVYSTVDGRRYM